MIGHLCNIAMLAETGISWRGFVKYWLGFVHSSDRVVLVVGLIAALSLVVITRGKWMR